MRKQYIHDHPALILIMIRMTICIIIHTETLVITLRIMQCKMRLNVVLHSVVKKSWLL